MIETQPSTNNTKWLALGGCLLAFTCICCVCAVSVGLIVYAADQDGAFDTATPVSASAAVPTNTITAIASSTPTAVSVNSENDAISTPIAAANTPTSPPTDAAPPLTHLAIPKRIEQAPIPPRAGGDLIRLYEGEYPAHDFYETAVRLSSKNLGDRIRNTPPYSIGDARTFASNEGTHSAHLLYITDHIYFWMEDGLNLNKAEIRAAADRLENEYLPRLTTLFGDVWTPGIDGDPHFSILHIDGENNDSELGWFIDTNEYPRTIYTDSNEQELIFMVMSNLETSEPLYDGTLVHEIQHLIQWHMDANEPSWMNEGLSQLAEIYVGLETVDAYDYLIAPETRLNEWDSDEDTVDAHYANAYLYAVYIWEQLGDEGVQALSHHSANGLLAVRDILELYAPDRSLEQFTADWAAANYLDAPNGRYGYAAIDLDDVAIQYGIGNAAYDEVNELGQFGVHYISLDMSDPTTLSFVGDTAAPLIDNAPPDGGQFWYAPSVDDVDAVLQRPFDLRTLNSATLTFDTWYDLEKDWDYTYLTISTDGGANWQLLVPKHISAGEYGPGWNGKSANEKNSSFGWVSEEVSLNNYVGEEVIIRFDLLTDSAVNGRGFAIDNIAIPELLYMDDGEQPSDWQAVGFIQTGWQLPQQWSVQWVHDGTVENLPLNSLNQGEWLLEGDSILIIMPQTPFIDEMATYWIKK